MARKPRSKAARASADRRWRSPVEPAPGDLRIVQALLNTAATWNKREELADPELLAAWLKLWDLVPDGIEIRRAELRRMLGVREALRTLMRARSGKAAPAAAKLLDGEARQALVRARFDAGGGVRYQVAAPGFEGALARIFDLVSAAQLDGSWRHFRLCSDPQCGQAFYDYSTNHRGKWCQGICGNRRSAAAYRRRRPPRVLGQGPKLMPPKQKRAGQDSS